MSIFLAKYQPLPLSIILGLLVTVFFLPAKLAAQIPVISDSDSLYSVAAVDKDHAWVVGYWGKVLHTADGGETWELQKSGTEEPLYCVRFINDKQGIITGQKGIILLTHDGGKTWVRASSGTKSHLISVDYADNQNIWAVGDFGTILHSPDGGKTWKDRSILSWPAEILGKFLRPEESFDPAILNRVYFYDNKHGWIIGEFAHILHTQDGGLTWQPQENFLDEIPSNTYFFDIKFRDLNQGWLVGIGGTILTTGDGGQSWNKVQVDMTQPLYALGIGQEVFAFGSVGTALRYSSNPEDGWHKIKDVETVNWLRGAAFSIDGDTGWVIGGRGTILNTRDGGRTWQVVSPPKQ